MMAQARGWGQRKIETELKRRHVVLDDIPGYPEDYFAVEDDLAACVSPARQAACSRDARIRKTGSVFDGQGLLVSRRRRCR